MDRHKQVSALGVRQGRTLAQWDCLVLVSRHHHLKGSLFEQMAQAYANIEGHLFFGQAARR